MINSSSVQKSDQSTWEGFCGNLLHHIKLKKFCKRYWFISRPSFLPQLSIISHSLYFAFWNHPTKGEPISQIDKLGLGSSIVWGRQRETRWEGKEKLTIPIRKTFSRFELKFPFNHNLIKYGGRGQDDSSITLLRYLLVVELTLVLLRDLREIIESPQLTTVPLLIEKVRSR